MRDIPLSINQIKLVMEITIKTSKELAAVKKKYSGKFIFIPSGPGGKISYPVVITVSK